MIDSLDAFSGSERQLASNLRMFNHDLLLHEVAVITRNPPSKADEVEEYASIHTLIDTPHRVTRARVTTRLHSLVTELQPDLVHSTLPDSSLATRVIARTTGVRAVESLVNISHELVRTIDNPNVTAAKLAFHRTLDRVTMRSLIGFHAVSRAVADSWNRTVGLDPEKVIVIPRGIEVDWLEMTDDEDRSATQSVRNEFGIIAEAPLLISVGRVEPQKGHRYLVKAIAHLKDEYPDLTALIVGRPGHSSTAVQDAIDAANLGSSIVLTGPRDDLPRLLAASDIFVFPSLFEGNGGNAMIEAMAAGLPIVTTGEPPMTDLIPDSNVGLLVDRCDSSGLADAIRRLIDDQVLRRELASAARKQVDSFLTPREAAARHEDWYLSLITS